MSEKHSPLPWFVVAGDDYYIQSEGYPKEFSGHFKGDANCPYVAIVGNYPKDFGEANAALIVRSVNALPELVSALEDCAGCVDGAEAEGLLETINSLRDSDEFSDTDVFRLIDLIERRLVWPREYARTALSKVKG